MQQGLDFFAYDLAWRALQALGAELEHTRGGAPARVGVYSGEEIAAMDECCAGQAAVRVYRIFPVTGRWPQQNHGPAGRLCNGVDFGYGVTLEFTVYRCASTINDMGDPPSVEHIGLEAATQLDDAAALRRAMRKFAAWLALREVPYSGGGDYTEDDYNPIGPTGDCVGGRQRFSFLVYDCPPDTPPNEIIE